MPLKPPIEWPKPVSLSEWIGRVHLTTYMIWGAWVAVAMVAHPSLTNYMTVLCLGLWMFVIRDMSRLEGRTAKFSYWGLISMAAILGIVIFFATISKFVII